MSTTQLNLNEKWERLVTVGAKDVTKARSETEQERCNNKSNQSEKVTE
jgi:hypothetical protein